MAIRHVVMWKMADQSKEEKAKLARSLALALAELEGEIGGLRSVTAEPDTLDEAGSWDLVLIADLDDKAALDAYQEHPLHVAVAGKIKAAVVARAAVDFEVVD